MWGCQLPWFQVHRRGPGLGRVGRVGWLLGLGAVAVNELELNTATVQSMRSETNGLVKVLVMSGTSTPGRLLLVAKHTWHTSDNTSPLHLHAPTAITAPRPTAEAVRARRRCAHFHTH